MLRCPRLPGGRLLYRLRHRWRDGTTHVVFEPQELLEKLAALARAVPATIIGTYLALILMMKGIALAPASVAAVLLSTPPVFGLVLEALTERRVRRPRALVGTLIAVGGVAVLTAVRTE